MSQVNMLETGPKFIPEDKVKEIREACSIVEVISDYVSLKKTGTNYRGLCPFHNEKTPSFFVNEEKKFFNCFGCGERGDVFSFLMKHENMNFQEAVRSLSKRTGISLPEKALTPQQQKMLGEREECFGINESAAKFYNDLLLQDRAGEEAKNYLIKRGINIETIKDYCLGFAPEGWGSVVKYLRSKNLSLPNAQKLGLIIGKGNGQYYDRFRNRIVFPIYNVSHRIMGFGGRIISEGEPKYLNSPESFIYQKRRNLYGLQTALKYIKKENRVIIVEGYIDLLSLHQAGIKNTVAALGTALTEQQIQILKRYTSNIITVFDSDPSGKKAMIRSLEPFLNNSVSPRVVILPPGDDPDSFVRKQGQKAFVDRIENAGSLFDFVVGEIVQRNQTATPRGKIDACEEVVPFLKMISDEMERDLYVQKVSQKLGIKQEHIYSKMGSTSKPGRFARSEKPVLQTTSAFQNNAEKLILRIMIDYPETIDIVEKEALLEDFTEPDLKELGKLLCMEIKQHGKHNLPYLFDKLENESWKKIIAELSFQDNYAGNHVKTLEDCIRDLRLRKSSRERKKVKALIEQAETTRDDSLSLKYQLEYQNLLQEERKIQRYKLNFYQI